MAKCDGNNALEETSAKVNKFIIAKAAEDLVSSGTSFSFPIVLYIVNEKDVIQGSAEPELYFDNVDPDKMRNEKVINSAQKKGRKCVYKYCEKYNNRSELKKVLGVSSRYATRRVNTEIEPLDRGGQWSTPSLTLAMTKKEWIRIGENAGWLKLAQEQQPMIPIGQAGSSGAQAVAAQVAETNQEQAKRIQEALSGGNKQMATQIASLNQQLKSKQDAYNVAGCNNSDKAEEPDCLEIKNAIEELEEQIDAINQKINKNNSDLEQLTSKDLIGGMKLV